MVPPIPCECRKAGTRAPCAAEVMQMIHLRYVPPTACRGRRPGPNAIHRYAQAGGGSPTPGLWVSAWCVPCSSLRPTKSKSFSRPTWVSNTHYKNHNMEQNHQSRRNFVKNTSLLAGGMLVM